MSERLEEIKAKLSDFQTTVWDISEDDYMFLYQLAERTEEAEKIYDEQLEETEETYAFLNKEIDRLREALKFYADEETYKQEHRYYGDGNVETFEEPITLDLGEMARQALEVKP